MGGDAGGCYLQPMPIWIHLANLIVLKQAVEHKFPGGLEGFRAEYEIDDPENFQQEDGELFSISAMNASALQADAGRLIDLGFLFDERNDGPNELAILTRYGGVAARPAWLCFNSFYAWHNECSAASRVKVEAVQGMDRDAFEAQLASGELRTGAIFE